MVSTKSILAKAVFQTFMNVAGVQSFDYKSDIISATAYKTDSYESRDKLCRTLGIVSGKENAVVTPSKPVEGKPAIAITHWEDGESQGFLIRGLEGYMPTMPSIRPDNCVKRTKVMVPELMDFNPVRANITEDYGRSVLREADSKMKEAIALHATASRSIFSRVFSY